MHVTGLIVKDSSLHVYFFYSLSVFLFVYLSAKSQ